MKRLFFLTLALCVLLCACSSLVPSDYVRVSEYAASDAVVEDTDVLSANDFESLKDAIRSFVMRRIEHGVIRVQRYQDGDVEEDLASAAYQIAREDPYGAYMVDYMTHSCSLIVSYYEIGIDITFREGALMPEKLSYAAGDATARTLLQQAMNRYDDRLVLYVERELSVDLVAEAADYYAQNPGRLMAMPEVHRADYPESGVPRIIEMSFQYPESAQTLREMAQAVEDTLSAASVYVRYRDTQTEKAELLFTYLLERFSYVEYETQTPVYSHLCDGLTESRSAAQSWQLLCDRVGLECVTVSGLYQGAEHWWNILCLDGEYSHVDTFRDLLSGGPMHLYSDAEMSEYYWDAAQYPACVHAEPEPEEDPEALPEEPPLDPESGEQPDEEAPPPPEEAEPETPSEPSADSPEQPEAPVSPAPYLR